MKTFAKICVLSIASTLLVACGGGGGGSGGSAPPPANATTNFNTSVSALATTDASPDAAESTPLDINTQTWQFEENEDAFADLFEK